MAIKLIVAYPLPTNIGAFEQVYQQEHIPLAMRKLEGKTKLVSNKILASPQGAPPYYRIAEIHFPSMMALETCAASAGGREALEHAMKISSGGPPQIMIAEEECVSL
jgi:uncharacterized protein (TIGR02118 family)